jgi:Escherichia/Staphylococcus phage prohead protease
MDVLAMELREVDEAERVIVGVVAPYDEITYLVNDPNGERIRRGAFSRSIAHRGAKIPLLRGHSKAAGSDSLRPTGIRYGLSRTFSEDAGGLLGEFVVNRGDPGDLLLEDCRNGYLGALSAGWLPLDARRGSDGVREISEAKLVEVSIVAVPAYEGAAMLAVRNAQDLDALLAPFRARPDVNLDPITPLPYSRH